MDNKFFKGGHITLYVLPRKLKWYEKILQKLHIKNYYIELGCVENPVIEEKENENIQRI